MLKLLPLIFIFFTLNAFAADFQKGYTAYQSGDYTAAIKEWKPLAEQGDANTQYNLGVMYANGQGVAQDDAHAVYWYRKAVEQGDASAQNNLGGMYAEGRGVDKNYAWAVYWYALAAQNGNTLAADNIESNLSNLTKLAVNKDNINIREKASASSKVLLIASKNSTLYSLNKQNGWFEVYSRTGNTIGYVADFLVTEHKPKPSSNGPYPAAPAPDPRPGYVTCRTNCQNSNCYRTYSDGRQVHFQAQQKWDSFNNTWTWDSGSC